MQLRRSGTTDAILRLDEARTQIATRNATNVERRDDRESTTWPAGHAVPGLTNRPLPDRATLNRELNVFRTTAVAAAGTGVRETRRFEALPYSMVSVTSEQALLRLLNAPETGLVGANRRFRPTAASTLPFIGQPAAHAAGLSGAGSVIGVFDTGAAGLPQVQWTEEIAPSDGVDDDTGHGTNVAAIASAVAPGAKLAVADVFWGGFTDTAYVLSAVSWLTGLKAAGANVVAATMSFGSNEHEMSSCPDVYGFDSLLAWGIQPVVAAGNAGAIVGVFEDGLSAPACAVGTLSVGAVYDSAVGTVNWPAAGCFEASAPDKPLCTSQTSPELSLLAPGHAVTAGGATFSGSSQAAPHVSGALAAVLGCRPSLSLPDAVALLSSTGVPTLDTRPPGGRTTPRLAMSALATAIPAPANDARSAAQTITLPMTATTDACLASAEPGEPAHAGVTAANSVWYRVTTTGRTGIAVQHPSGGRVGVYAAASASAPPAVSCPTAAGAPCAGFVVAAGTYDVAIDIDTSTSGPAPFTISSFDVGSDSRAGAATIAAAVTDADTGATIESGEANPSNVSPTRSVWYRVVAPTGGRMAVTLAATGAPMRIAVYDSDGSTIPRAVSLAGSSVTAGPFLATSGATYDIQVMSTSPATSAFTLAWTTGGVPLVNPHDVAPGAFPLGSTVSGVQALDNAGATADSGLAGNVWAKWVAPTAGNVTFRTNGSNLDTVTQLYRGTDAVAMTALGTSGDLNTNDVGWSSLGTSVSAGDTLWLSIGSQNGRTEGTVIVSWDVYFRANAPEAPESPSSPRAAAPTATPGTPAPRGAAPPVP